MRKPVSGIMLTLLLVATLTLAFNIHPAKIKASLQGESVQAGDVDWWPMFHHDTAHNGYSNSTAPKTNRTLWNYTTGSYVDSSPAVADGVVYVGSGNNNVYALNATTRAFLWSYHTSDVVDSSPAVVGGFVFVGSWDGNVYALNATTGKLVWSKKTGGPIVHSSPAVVGGFVFVGSWDGYVYALNATTGKLVWSKKTGGPIEYSSPAVADGVVYVGSTDHNVYALNVATGAVVWSYPTGGVVKSSPAVAGGVVFVGSDDDNVYAIGLNPSPDVAVTGVMSSKTVVGQGFSTSISVTVANQDNRAETFKVTAYANAISIASQNVTLSSGNSVTITFAWNTTGFAKGDYTISAYAWPVRNETDTTDNNCTGGWVLIAKVGDLGSGAPVAQFFQCDGIIDASDIGLFIRCLRGTAPPDAMYLGDLGGGAPVAQFFQCDGIIDASDTSLFVRTLRGTGPPDP